jgi:hypothetical protein
VHIFFITLLVLVALLVAWFSALTVAKLFKGQS